MLHSAKSSSKSRDCHGNKRYPRMGRHAKALKQSAGVVQISCKMQDFHQISHAKEKKCVSCVTTADALISVSLYPTMTTGKTDAIQEPLKNQNANLQIGGHAAIESWKLICRRKRTEIRKSRAKWHSLLRITSRYPKYLRNLQFFERRIHSIFSQERAFTCLDAYLLTSRVSQHSIAILTYYLSCCYRSVSGLLTLTEGLRKSHWMN